MAAMQVDAVGSRAEEGCLRFDCLRDTENPCKFCANPAPANSQPLRRQHRFSTGRAGAPSVCLCTTQMPLLTQPVVDYW